MEALRQCRHSNHAADPKISEKYTIKHFTDDLIKQQSQNFIVNIIIEVRSNFSSYLYINT